MDSLEDWVQESGATKNCKLIVFESQPMPLFQWCQSCGLEAKLETSIRGTLLVLNGICPDGHVLHWQSQPMVRDTCGLTFTSIASLADVFNLAIGYRRNICILQCVQII